MVSLQYENKLRDSCKNSISLLKMRRQLLGSGGQHRSSSVEIKDRLDVCTIPVRHTYLLVFTIMAGDGAVSCLCLDRLAIRTDQHTGHQTKGTITCTHTHTHTHKEMNKTPSLCTNKHGIMTAWTSLKSTRKPCLS